MTALSRPLLLVSALASVVAMVAAIVASTAVQSLTRKVPQECVGYVPAQANGTPVLVPVNLCGKVLPNA